MSQRKANSFIFVQPTVRRRRGQLWRRSSRRSWSRRETSWSRVRWEILVDKESRGSAILSQINSCSKSANDSETPDWLICQGWKSSQNKLFFSTLHTHATKPTGRCCSWFAVCSLYSFLKNEEQKWTEQKLTRLDRTSDTNHNWMNNIERRNWLNRTLHKVIEDNWCLDILFTSLIVL